MVIVLGEILIDVFPEDRRIGGAPFNFAFHLKQMGVPVRFITRVGDDADGRQILARLRSAGFETADVQIDPHHPSGTVRVALDDDGVPRFTICEDVAYDHLDLTAAPTADRHAPRMIYFGSLVQRTDGGHRQVRGFLDSCDESAVRFCDINLRPPHVNPEALVDALHRTDLLKLSGDELADIAQRLDGPPDEKHRIDWLMETFAIRSLALTRGERGSTFIGSEGTFHQPAAPTPSVADTVGAGDGYAAVLAAGMLRRLPLRTILDQASCFAARICGINGAVPDGAAFYVAVREAMKGDADGR